MSTTWRSPARRRTTATRHDSGRSAAFAGLSALCHSVTPAARIQAAIELTLALDADGRPADQVVAAFLRQRRYIGAGDRRRLLELAYAVLRHRARLDWWLERAGTHPADAGERARLRVIAALLLLEGWSADRLAGSFDGARHHPPKLESGERALAGKLVGQAIEQEEQPRAVRLECPEWLLAHFQSAFGARLDIELRALLEEAAPDLRVNRRKAASRDAVKAALANEGIETQPTPLSPLGLRASGRAALAATASFKDGLVEVQDEGSQIVALLTDARPGMRVVDFCAGAGGKTLALAAAMENRGQLLALDVLEGRLRRARERLRRSGADNVERRLLKNHRDPWLKRRKGAFDRVLVDAPCSGTGAWRRNPDARWRFAPEDLERLIALQGEILDSAQRLVKTGGRLVYATCSLLEEENSAQVEAFLARHPSFRVRPFAEVWRETIGGEAPETGPFLRLTPARHGTDGFFVAILERQAAKGD